MGTSQSTTNPAPIDLDDDPQPAPDLGTRTAEATMTDLITSRDESIGTQNEKQRLDMLEAKLEQLSAEVRQLRDRQAQSNDAIEELTHRLNNQVQQLRRARPRYGPDSDDEDHRMPSIFGLAGGRIRRR